ncbi:MAG: hypothetical protein ACREFU_13590 [Acetobacteraceae bacterium]
MKNAHERFGWLEFSRELKDSAVRVRLRLDRLIAEIGENSGTLHLLSVVGGECDVGAVWAAALSNHVFTIEGPALGPVALSLGEKAECFRGSLNVPGRRAVRHLVAVSAEMAATRLGGGIESNRTILSDNDPVFVLYRLSERFGLPVVPQWAEWFTRELRRRRAITPLAGIGCNPVLIVGTKDRFLAWISQGIKRGMIEFPERNGPVSWPAMPGFLDRPPAPPTNLDAPTL